jgi:hypothetical protein
MTSEDRTVQILAVTSSRSVADFCDAGPPTFRLVPVQWDAVIGTIEEKTVFVNAAFDAGLSWVAVVEFLG